MRRGADYDSMPCERVIRMQRSFAEYDGFRKQRKVTRREAFLAEMDRVVPWQRLEALIEPHYPSGGTGRKPYPFDAADPLPPALVWVFGPRDGGSAARHPCATALRRPGRGHEPDAGRDDDPELSSFAGRAPTGRTPVSGGCRAVDGSRPDPARGHHRGRHIDRRAAV